MQTYPDYLRKRRPGRAKMSKARAFTIYTQTLAAAWIAGGLLESAMKIGATFAQNMVIIFAGYGQ